jgi:hypothetical protein
MTFQAIALRFWSLDKTPQASWSPQEEDRCLFSLKREPKLPKRTKDRS